MDKSKILISFFAGAMLGVSVTFFVMNEDDKEVNSEIVEIENDQVNSKEERVYRPCVYIGKTGCSNRRIRTPEPRLE